jgi:hypothetical protein
MEQEVITSPPFTITRVTLIPEDVVTAPMGQVLHVGFAGTTAFAWVKHHPAEDRVMNVVTLPTGGPFTLETAAGFREPIHVGSFQKTAAVQLSKQVEQKVAMAWHVFAWHPLPIVPVSPEPSTLN